MAAIGAAAGAGTATGPVGDRAACRFDNECSCHVGSLRCRRGAMSSSLSALYRWVAAEVGTETGVASAVGVATLEGSEVIGVIRTPEATAGASVGVSAGAAVGWVIEARRSGEDSCVLSGGFIPSVVPNSRDS